MTYDFNVLEMSAEHHIQQSDFDKALAIYFYMADGDQSLDGGYLGMRIAECYEAMGQLFAAGYWYARAIEENPVVRASCADAKSKLGDLSIDKYLLSGARP